MIKSHIFNGVLIGGMPSSGSTLLSVMLDSHSEVLCGPETTLFSHSALWDEKVLNGKNAWDAWFSKNQTDNMLQWSLVDLNSLTYYGSTQNEVITLAEQSNNLFEFGDNFFRQKMNFSNARVWVEKTPQNIYAANTYLRANDQSKFIITIRDPRAIIDSLLRRGMTAEMAVRVWVLEANIIYYLVTDVAINSRIKLIKYEDLIQDTQNVLTSVCSFLGISDESETMLTRNSSERKFSDDSLKKTEGSAAIAWKKQPFDKISDSRLYEWESSVSSLQYDTLLHTQVNSLELNAFLKGMELRKPDPLDAWQLIDYFGFIYRQKYEESNSVFENFYFSKVTFNSFIGKAVSANESRKVLTEKLYVASVRIDRVKARIARYLRVLYSRLLSLLRGLIRLPKRVAKKVYQLFLPLLGVKTYRYAQSAVRKLKPALLKARILKYKLLDTIHNIKPNYSKKYAWNKPLGQNETYDLVVVIAFSGRHSVLKAVISEIFNVSQSELNIGVVLACTDDKDVNFSRLLQKKYPKLGYSQCENNPLGNKWHIAVQSAKKLNPNAIMITGSDDLVTTDYMVNNYRILTTDPLNIIGMVGPRVWYILDSSKEDSELWKIAYKNEHHHMPLGAGRMYTASYLDTVNWNIFDRSLESQLDDKGYYEVLANELSIYCPTLDDGVLVSIKGNWSAMNPMDLILSADTIMATKATKEERTNLLKVLKNPLKELDTNNQSHTEAK